MSLLLSFLFYLCLLIFFQVIIIPKGLFLFCCCFDFCFLFFFLHLEGPALYVSFCPISSLKSFSSSTTKVSNLICGHFNINEVFLLLNCFYNYSLLLNKGQDQSHLEGRRAYTLLASTSYSALQL